MLSDAKKANICWEHIWINMMSVNMMETSEIACKYQRTKGKQCQTKPTEQTRQG